MNLTNNNTLGLIPPHGGYRTLASYQNAEIVYDATVAFCKRYKSYMTYKTYEQMIGAARSGKQNIAEGSQMSGTSKKTELKLVGVARASLEELLIDYHDFLREYSLHVWDQHDPRILDIRKLVYTSYKSYKTYEPLILEAPESGANALITLIRQTCFLLDRQLAALEKAFLQDGGFTERLFRERRKFREK